MRTEKWLIEQMDFIFGKYFPDVKITNPIEIRFGREARYRFGSIKLYKSRRGRESKSDRAGEVESQRVTRGLKGFGVSGFIRKEPEKSLITVTSMFKNEDVPIAVVQYTVAHELCHYAHGFSSYNKRMFKHPHHGGVVNKEIKKRGGEHLITAYKEWLKKYRKSILEGKTKF